MKRISVLLTKYSDWISCFLYHISGHGYTHASIGLEDGKQKYYSFNYKGFCEETVEKHRRRGVRKSISYELEISDQAYAEMQQKVEHFHKEKDSLRYTRIGLACAILHIPFRWKGHYICSQFVAELLSETGAVPMRRASSLYLPNQIAAELLSCSQLKAVVSNPV